MYPWSNLTLNLKIKFKHFYKSHLKSFLIFIFVLCIASISFFNSSQASTKTTSSLVSTSKVETLNDLTKEQWSKRLEDLSYDLKKENNDGNKQGQLLKQIHVELEKSLMQASAKADNEFLEKQIIIYNKMNLLALNELNNKKIKTQCKMIESKFKSTFEGQNLQNNSSGESQILFEDQKLCEWIQTICKSPADYCTTIASQSDK